MCSYLRWAQIGAHGPAIRSLTGAEIVEVERDRAGCRLRPAQLPTRLGADSTPNCAPAQTMAANSPESAGICLFFVFTCAQRKSARMAPAGSEALMARNSMPAKTHLSFCRHQFLASAVAGNLGVIDRVVVRGDIAGISLVAVLDRLSGGVNVDVLLPALEVEVRRDDDDGE